ncbi:hypothetical protein NIES25_02690 [Nostoc linckia NIES-25]|nr:hypothetical protein NIES25_02690 [Nostoc linckia NIES-25]
MPTAQELNFMHYFSLATPLLNIYFINDIAYICQILILNLYELSQIMKKTTPVQLMIVTIEDAIHRVSTSCVSHFFWKLVLYLLGFFILFIRFN